MTKRLAIYVEDDIPDLLLELVDGPREQGEFISNLVRATWENQHVSRGATLDGLRFQMIGLIAELQELKGRVTTMESKVTK